MRERGAEERGLEWEDFALVFLGLGTRGEGWRAVRGCLAVGHCFSTGLSLDNSAG